MLRYALLLAGLKSVTAAPLSVHGIEQSCVLQKWYGLLVKVLLVYGSHALTVKGKAGSSAWDGFLMGLSALLCPGFASHRAFMDLWMAFNAHGVKGCVNTESACFRIKLGQYPVLWGTVARGKINMRTPLQQDERLVMIPRGKDALFCTEAHLFGRRAQLKAVLGIIQLAFGVIQLVTTSGVLVNRYGTGCYIFTIIPYAFASLINGLAAIFTPQYSEIQELHLKAGVGRDAVIEAFGPPASGPPTFALHAFALLLSPPAAAAAAVAFDSDSNSVLGSHVVLEVVTYLAIMGGLTGFDKRESTITQRGWLVSWPIVGIVAGSAFGLISSLIYFDAIGGEAKDNVIEGETKSKAITGEVKDEVIKGEETKDEVIEGEVTEAIEGEMKDQAIKGKETRGKVIRAKNVTMIIAAITYGVPTIGGLVILSQQYLTNFICTD